MPNLNENINNFIKNQFPDRFKIDGKLLVEFIKTYYEWLDSNDETINLIRRFKEFRDSQKAPDKFFEFLRHEFMVDLPNDLKVDEKLLVDHIVDFYKSKGTEKACKLLFKIIYNEDIEIYYPGVDLLRVSDGRWQRNQFILINCNVENSDILENRFIHGRTSNASAEILNVEDYVSNNIPYKKIIVDNIKGSFIQNETLYENVSNTNICILKSNGVQEGKGYYVGTFGQVSSDKRIQDSFYWQEYSYVIKSKQPINNYENNIKLLNHPLGSIMFGQIDESSKLNFNINYDRIFTYTGDQSKFVVVYSNYNNINYDDSDLCLENINVYNNNIYINYEDSYLRFTDANGLLGLGKVSIDSNNHISHYTNRIDSYLNIPIGLIGSTKLIYGSNTYFNIELSANDSIKIIDNINSIANTFIVDSVYNNNILSITTNYPYSIMANSSFYIL